MNKRIAARLHPFSHVPGTLCLLPKTHLKVRVFPARVEFSEQAVDWELQGPVKNFTVELDLEHEQITVFGMTRSGYVRYHIRVQGDSIAIVCDKAPFVTKETLLIPYSGRVHTSVPLERLSLGMHKLQDWDRIRNRLDFKEIFPIWMRIGQITPSAVPSSSNRGTLQLLRKCSECVEKNAKEEILSAFTQLFLAGSEGICVPRLFDTDYQGIIPIQPAETGDPLPLEILTQGAALIRSLFFKEEGNVLSLLPCLPPDFHVGRMMDVHTQYGDRVDLEWSKKQMRSICIRPQSERQMHLQLSRHLRTCRVRTGHKDKGIQCTINEGILILDLSPERSLFIDRFQK
jgi:hypothetical protein